MEIQLILKIWSDLHAQDDSTCYPLYDPDWSTTPFWASVSQCAKESVRAQQLQAVLLGMLVVGRGEETQHLGL